MLLVPHHRLMNSIHPQRIDEIQRMSIVANDIALNDGEKIILSDARISSESKLTLTNQRLICFQLKGWLHSRYCVKESLPINKIEEAYVKVESFTGMCTMKLRLQDHSERECSFAFSGRDVLFPSGQNQTIQRAITDRWVNAINRAIQKKE